MSFAWGRCSAVRLERRRCPPRSRAHHLATLHKLSSTGPRAGGAARADDPRTGLLAGSYSTSAFGAVGSERSIEMGFGNGEMPR
jgi:hypothetical protein